MHGICYTLFLLVLPLLVLAGLNVRLIREVKALGRVLPLLVLAGLNVRLIREVKALGRRRLGHDDTRTTIRTGERDETNRENPNIASNE